MSSSTDYHDYVFKNGEFIGKFEEMYQNVEEILKYAYSGTPALLK